MERYKLESHAELEAYIEGIIQTIKDLPPTEDDTMKGCRIMMRHVMPAFCRATFEMKDLHLNNEDAIITISSVIVNMFDGILSTFNNETRLQAINDICNHIHEILTSVAKGEGADLHYIKQPSVS